MESRLFAQRKKRDAMQIREPSCISSVFKFVYFLTLAVDDNTFTTTVKTTYIPTGLYKAALIVPSVLVIRKRDDFRGRECRGYTVTDSFEGNWILSVANKRRPRPTTPAIFVLSLRMEIFV